MRGRRRHRGFDEPVRTAALAVVATAVVAVGLTVTGTPRFMVNDDLAMESFVSGDFTGKPSPYMVFTSTVIGLPLSLAYRVSSSVPWYAIGLVTVQVTAIATIGAVTWRRRSHLGPLRTAAVVAVLVMAIPTLLLSLSFTAAALVVGIASIVLLLLRATSATRVATVAFLTGVLGLGLVAAMRFDALVAIAAVFAPTLVVGAWFVPRRLIAVGAVTLAGLLGVVTAVDSAMNARAGWPEFSEFNDIRGSLHGTAGLAELSASMIDPSAVAALQDVGWNPDDLLLFDGWFFDDPSTYDVDRLDALQTLIGERDHRRSIGTSLSLVVDGREWMVAAIACCAVLALWRANRRGRLLLAVQVPWAFAVFTATASTQRFPDRIAVPLLTGFAIVVVLAPHLAGTDRATSGSSRWADLSHPPAAVATAAILSTALLYSVGGLGGAYSISGLDDVASEMRATYRSHLDTLEEVDPVGRFVYSGAYVMIEGAAPYQRPGVFGADDLIGVGWPTFSPLYEARRERMGLPGNLLEQLLTQEHLYLVIGSGMVPVIERTYERRLGERVQLIDLAELGNGGVVFRIRPADPVSVGV